MTDGGATVTGVLSGLLKQYLHFIKECCIMFQMKGTLQKLEL